MLSGAASRISISDGKDVKKIIKNIETQHGTYPKADASFSYVKERKILISFSRLRQVK